jgi:hypothetical protein
VLETIHWVVKPEATLKPVADIALVDPAQMLAAPVKEATGVFGKPAHAGGGEYAKRIAGLFALVVAVLTPHWLPASERT